VVLDIIHVAAAMRRAVLVAGSSKGLSACRPRLPVLKRPRGSRRFDAYCDLPRSARVRAEDPQRSL